MSLNATEKVLKILTAFLPFNEPRGTLELAEALGIHRASVSRILGILKENDFVEQDVKTRRYRLGPVAAALRKSVKLSLQTHFVPIVQPYIHQLIEATSESIALVVLMDHQVILPYRLKGPQPNCVSFKYGDRGSINANSGAKAIMAHYREDRLAEIMEAYPRLPNFTSNTITDWDELIEQFESIRQTGLGFDLEEYRLKVLSVGAPIFDYNDDPIGALTIIVPSFRAETIKDPRMHAALKKAVDAISKKLMNRSLSSSASM